MAQESPYMVERARERTRRGAAFRGTMRTNLERASDFIARASELAAVVEFNGAQLGSDANAAVLWNCALPDALPTSLLLAGVSEANARRLRDVIRGRNERLLESVAAVRRRDTRAA